MSDKEILQVLREIAAGISEGIFAQSQIDEDLRINHEQN